MSRIMILPSERVSDWIAKGEVVERYWNPGTVFDEVDLVAIAPEDGLEPGALEILGGGVPVHVHDAHLPARALARATPLTLPLLAPWLDRVVAIAAEARPDVIRCHGAHLNALAARRVRERLGIPYVVSVHVNPDEDVRGRARSPADRVRGRLLDSVEGRALRGADLVLPVYEPIVPFLRRHGVTRYEVAYNVVAGDNLRRKADYALHRPVRIVSVGRLFEQKNPVNLIRAVNATEDAELLVVGDGPYRPRLEAIGGPRVRFAPALPNDELCATLAEQDVFAIHTEYWELSKAVLEALLTGLPVVINRRRGEPVPELADPPGLVRFVEDSVAGYRDGLRALIEDDELREHLGRRGREHAEEHWSPARNEARFAAIYRRLLSEAGR